MTSRTSKLPPEFIASQKARLLAMRQELLTGNRAAAGEEAQLQSDSLDAPEGSGDDAQKTNLRDNDAALFEHNVARVQTIDRALEKIEDGTYGLSDGSGEPIPKDRLEAVPESLGTVEE
jgi:DnaK suppressor protein